MTIKEKAKAYDEALQTAKMYYQQNKDFNDKLACLPIIFPKLKESEDDMIRKEIVDYLKKFIPHCDDDLVAKSKVWISWLEKQQKPTDVEEPNFFDDFRKSDVEVDSNEDGLIAETIRYKKEQKPIWSDYDEYVYNEILKRVEKKKLYEHDLEYIYNWLKFLKDRVQPQSKLGEKDEKKPYVISTNRELLSLQHEVIGWLEDHKQFAAKDDIQYIQDCIEKIRAIQLPQWSEEDEGIINGILQLCNSADVLGIAPDPMSKIKNWLKSLKDRVQPKNEWSEEDDINLGKTIWYVENPSPMVVKDSMLVEWLKSFKYRVQPQNTWKPSDKQMEVLLSEVTAWTKGCPKQIVLESLYNDLKKLKENSYE